MAALSTGLGLAWPFAKSVSPSASAVINQIATNPVAWFVVFILGFTASLLRAKQKGTPTKNATKAADAPQERMFVDVPINHIRDLYKGRTSIQGDTLALVYIGKWMRVSGKVMDINYYDWAGRIAVSLVDDGAKRHEYESANLHLNFDESWKDVLALQKGVDIKVLGKITGAGESYVTLDDCELA